MNEPLVYISLTYGKDRLVIDGSFDLFKKFMNTVNQPTVYNTAPQLGEITAKESRHD